MSKTCIITIRGDDMEKYSIGQFAKVINKTPQTLKNKTVISYCIRTYLISRDCKSKRICNITSRIRE